MGRQVRRVPKDWQHPKYDNGAYIPLQGRCFEEDEREWIEWQEAWNEGIFPNGEPIPSDSSLEDYYGPRPRPEDYMPSWNDEERTHLMMYEDTSEGTPISPAFETAEELARWLADTGANAFGGMTASYGQWLAMINDGWAPSAAFTESTGLISGVEAAEKFKV